MKPIAERLFDPAHPADAVIHGLAIGTTGFHAIQAARSRPILALRYE
jgi:hypothetical protein